MYVIGYRKSYFDPFSHTCELVDRMEDADIILFTGGADVSPFVYGCTKHDLTYYSYERDRFEINEYKRSFELPNVKLRLGVCRGLQLLTALNGGLLIQDVTNHAGQNHSMINKNGEEYWITSLHHQMGYPFNLPEEDYEILYWSSTLRSGHYWGDKIDANKITKEPEVIWFPKTKSLGIQGHPEMMPHEDETVIMLNKLLISLL